MNKIGLGYLAISIWSISAHAVVDVYGVDKISSANILKKYAKNIEEIELYLQKQLVQENPSEGLTQHTDGIVKKRQSLIKEITKKYHYSFVNFESILYPSNDSFYTTIEIVDNKHPERMRFVNDEPRNISYDKKDGHKPDLIDAMNTYINTSVTLMVNHQTSSSIKSCPVYHCIAGFDHPLLKPYLRQFNNGVIKEKKFIIETLNSDPNPERRAAAAFLVGHFNNPQEIITVLTPHVVDKDEVVRNNAMRVIGETVRNGHIKNIDISPYIDALDSPYTSDRNKALLVLSNAIEIKSLQKEMLEKGADKLLELLALKQPNNHDLAYYILKKISQKDFGPTDVGAWRDWVAGAKNGEG